MSFGSVDISRRTYENIISKPKFDETFEELCDYLCGEDFYPGS